VTETTRDPDGASKLASSLLSRMKVAADAGDRLWVGLGRGVASLGPGGAVVADAPALLPARDPMVSSRGLDLLSAPACTPDASPDEETSSHAPDGSAAGVLPVLRALGQIVSEHEKSDYRSLDRDRRFWALIDLIATLRQSDVTGASSETSARLEEHARGEAEQEK